ncbi:AlpA family phage regulatory protein [Klebsiella pneumoniae]|uniref:helix-turn-helix transcriptional regulator n=1 Tax=Klebsiella pneumoniae TaxID=573 RepID=UPI0013717724|nr:AlpA family phage regulatory protein [Klebsiella pneumoniae]MCW9149346.1 AlpA family phage regulatory protein [Klebsiella pneumoniae]NAO13331.1 AlpA family phage regulatory protein [Klebsiella pneumoniae]
MATHNATTHTIPQSGYIRRFRLAELLGVSVSTIDRKVRSGSLPRPVKLGEKITAFDAVEGFVE